MKMYGPPTSRMLSDKALGAVLDTWSEPMLELSARLAELPERDSVDEIDTFVYIFAVDALHDKPLAVRMLLEVVDQFTVRPTHREVFETLARMLMMRYSVKQLVKDHGEYEKTQKPNAR